MFPAGRPGMALILLRLCLAASLFLHPGNGAAGLATLTSMACCIAVSMLVLGLFTPLAAGLVILLVIAGNLRVPPMQDVLLVGNALALGLIGPGAYSLDARFFGRRLLVFRRDAED